MSQVTVYVKASGNCIVYDRNITLGDVLKIECKWKVLRPDEYMVIRRAIKKKFGIKVKFFIPAENKMDEREMYAGDRKTPIYTYENGEPVYKNFSLNLIEM